MILIPNKKILLVADFGEDSGMDAIVNLKAAIESRGAYSVNIVDFPAMAIAGHQGEELSEARVIELCARKLEQLSSTDELVWDEPDHYPDEKQHDRPDTVVVFGKSAMLAGGLEGTDVLFVNPQYDSEWPWKKQYYADRRVAGQYHKNKYEYERNRMTTVTWSGKEAKIGSGYSKRYGVFTRDTGFYEFWDRYPQMAEMDEKLEGDTDGLADFICRFADGDITKLQETLSTRSKLKEQEKPQRRILIVPDFFTPYDSPAVRELYKQLTAMDYQVAVLMPDSTLMKSRQALERRCKSKPFDLIVTLETGCLLAARVTNCQRIFVNPDWCAWEWMNLRLGEEKQKYERRGADKSGPVYSYILNADEIEAAREMAERSNIRRGNHPAAGWFTEDAADSHLPLEHLKRFNTSTFIPSLRLDTEEGIDILATQIHNILSISD
jgi:hypothetical protein